MEPVAEQHIYKGRYRLTHLIARGGMAQVFRATDLALNRPVALKVLYPELSVDQNFVERFRREAQAAANLSHPNIVPVFDWGEEDGAYFIVMELVEGTSLAGLLRDQRIMAPARAASITAQVAGALAFAHRAGVVHRDVKPGNILITEEGVVKVTDFGIAQAISTVDHLTAAGSVMGTATYFSPEQAEGSLVDGRSDVYSLGVVLYELLAGRPPFVGDSPVSVAGMHVRDAAPSPLQFNTGIPADLEAITMMALAKNPSQRYQTADEMRSDLLRFSEGRPVQAAQRGGRAFASDTTQAVSVVSGERTQAVPIQAGPRTDVVRRRKSNTPLVATASALAVLLVAALGYFFLGSTATSVMPDVIGTSITEATSTITSQGLVVGATKLVQSTQPAGTVVASTPKPGAKVTKGQSVTLSVSLGTSTQPVTIPDVTGMSLSDAESTLQQAGLAYKVDFTATAPEGASPNTVLSQTPDGGTQGRTGDDVTITVLAPGSNYPVPNLAGKTLSDAAVLLGQAGLTLAPDQGSQCSNTAPEGSVVATEPAIGQPVSAGTAIKLVLSSGYCSVVVPNVVSLSKTAATSAMEAQGLVVSVTTLAASNPVCSGHLGQVVAQDIAPGASTIYNSPVTLTYCPAS
ncbi:MAG: Stk1 family PASTA domain-containing Ser/Thr kinase [Actinomycetes bacterium]